MRATFDTIYEVALGIAEQAQPKDHPLVVMTAQAQEAEKLNELVTSLQPSVALYYFPHWETLPYDHYAPSPNIISTRLETLYRLRDLKEGIVITSVEAIASRLCPPEYLYQHGFILSIGDRVSTEVFALRLTQAGFQQVAQVTEKGQFSQRGAIIDVFPPSSKFPIRIDFFDDEVETLRVFDVKTQLSAAKIEQVEIIPSREMDLSDEGRICFRQSMRRWLGADAENHQIYQMVSNAKLTGGLEYYLPFFFDYTVSFFDYLPSEAQITIASNYAAYFDELMAQIARRHQQISLLRDQALPEPEQLYINAEQFQGGIEKHLTNDSQLGGKGRFEWLSLSEVLSERWVELQDWIDEDCALYVFCQSDGQLSRIQEKLQKPLDAVDFKAWNQTTPAIGMGAFTASFTIECKGQKRWFISASQLMQSTAPQQMDDSPDLAAIINDLSQIAIGDAVVDTEYGVGRYLGLECVTVDDETNEYITLGYADDEKLYIPITDLDRISRYTGASPENAPLHRLDGKQWQKAKAKAKKRIHDTAVELLEIYAKREQAKGQAITIDQAALAEFAKGFDFPPTPDQSAAFASVYQDLQSEKPMDRIICGDVGFGKTEVALRAAFAVAESGGQVAVIVPTTLLAEQHYRHFTERFANVAITIEGLSRFRTAKEQREILDKIQKGQTDIVIGTHRLIQSDVRFANLGLVIVDEEHKFGVKQKEKLKALRSDVNILTMTATPIPRTLSMTLSGLRDLSIIASPPPKRTAVHTIFSAFDEAVINEGVTRELSRGGQVYFLHNDINTMNRVENTLQTLFPDLRIRHAHGKMPEKQLAQIMQDFHHHQFDILLTTTIIESGIDNPNANTIFINRADRFGLAQLHQLRGRVGRSHHQAYAYLLVPDTSLMTRDAQKRMAAFSAFNELGVGFMLASQDLEIRGAGELLGDNQSGHVTEIGFNLYHEMLAQTIAAIQENETIDFDVATEVSTQHSEIDLGMPALIPEDYIYDVHLRLLFYKRIASCQTAGEFDHLRVELIDRFGLLPEATKTLFAVSEIKQLIKGLGISKVMADETTMLITLADNHQLNNEKILELLQNQPKIYQLKGQHKLQINAPMPTVDERVKVFESWFKQCFYVKH